MNDERRVFRGWRRFAMLFQFEDRTVLLQPAPTVCQNQFDLIIVEGDELFTAKALLDCFQFDSSTVWTRQCTRFVALGEL